MTFQSDVIFNELGKRTTADIVSKVKGIYHFKITNGGESKSWCVDLKNGEGSVKAEAPTKADCTITIADDDYVNLILGKTNGQQLFMQGKLKISGNMAMAMKLNVLQKMAPSTSGTNGGFKSDQIFVELEKRMQEDPAMAKKINGVYCFVISNGSSEKKWIVDLKKNEIVENGTTKPDCTVKIADDDYVNLILGKANGQQLFMQGKLKISGNMAMAMKLSSLSAAKASL
eukprot:TRINITY_DN3562_c0_g1_i1.p1 TRINITY_DN3562_c0_g1~~TRINITY_DN3562_c0_g1_i1.p1  ORF type:complete len:229 (+),score=69.38 TRINITY_DN3562_c0_g1_i1:29-715(+)